MCIPWMHTLKTARICSDNEGSKTDDICHFEYYTNSFKQKGIAKTFNFVLVVVLGCTPFLPIFQVLSVYSP